MHGFIAPFSKGRHTPGAHNRCVGERMPERNSDGVWPALRAPVGSPGEQQFAQDGTQPGSGRNSTTGHLGKAAATTLVSQALGAGHWAWTGSHVCTQMRSRGSWRWSRPITVMEWLWWTLCVLWSIECRGPVASRAHCAAFQTLPAPQCGSSPVCCKSRLGRLQQDGSGRMLCLNYFPCTQNFTPKMPFLCQSSTLLCFAVPSEITESL